MLLVNKASLSALALILAPMPFYGEHSTEIFIIKYIHYVSTSFMPHMWKWKSCPTLCHPMDYTVHGILQARILEWVAFPFSRGSSQPRDWTQVSRIAVNPFPAEPQEKPKNTRVGSLSLFQGIFPIQEPNQGLRHCRWILYQLSYQEAQYIHTSYSLSLLHLCHIYLFD